MRFLTALFVVTFYQSAWAIKFSGDKPAAPFQISIRRSNTSCSAVALAPNCLLTASHCDKAAGIAWRQAYTNPDGSGNPVAGSVLANVLQKSVIFNNTDGLLVLQLDRSLPDVQGVPLATSPVSKGAAVIGYGNGIDENNRLHVSNAPLQNAASFTSIPAFVAYPTANPSGQLMKLTSGDSGGAMVVGGKLQGILIATLNDETIAIGADVGLFSQEVQAAKSAICTATVPRGNPVSCTIAPLTTQIMKGQSVSYVLTSSGPVVAANVMGKNISPFRSPYEGSYTPQTGVFLSANVRSATGYTSSCSARDRVIMLDKPSCELSTDPQQITQPGSRVKLTFKLKGFVTSATLDGANLSLPQIPANEVTLTQYKNPNATTTYTGKVMGPDNTSATCETTVTLQTAAKTPSCHIDISPQSVEQNGQATVTFTASGTYSSAQLNGQPVALTNNRYVTTASTSQVGTWSYTGVLKDAGKDVARCNTSYTVTSPTTSPTPSPRPSPSPTVIPSPTPRPSPTPTPTIQPNACRGSLDLRYGSTILLNCVLSRFVFSFAMCSQPGAPIGNVQVQALAGSPPQLLAEGPAVTGLSGMIETQTVNVVPSTTIGGWSFMRNQGGQAQSCEIARVDFY